MYYYMKSGSCQTINKKPNASNSRDPAMISEQALNYNFVYIYPNQRKQTTDHKSNIFIRHSLCWADQARSQFDHMCHRHINSMPHVLPHVAIDIETRVTYICDWVQSENPKIPLYSIVFSLFLGDHYIIKCYFTSLCQGDVTCTCTSRWDVLSGCQIVQQLDYLRLCRENAKRYAIADDSVFTRATVTMRA